jgi:hypothetical protein
MRRLTLKQKLFVNEYVKTKNGKKAVLKVYDTKNENVASSIASTMLRKENVKLSIEKILARVGYNPESSIDNLIAIEQAETKKITGSDKINASKFLLELAGYVTNRSITTSLNYNVDSQDNYNLIKYKDKYNKLINKRNKSTTTSST